MPNEPVDVQEGVQVMWIGESIAWQTNYQDADGNNMLDAQPSAVSNAELFDPDGSDVTSAQASGSAALSSWALKWPTMTPTSVGVYTWWADLTVSGNTPVMTRLRIEVRAGRPA